MMTAITGVAGVIPGNAPEYTWGAVTASPTAAAVYARHRCLTGPERRVIFEASVRDLRLAALDPETSDYHRAMLIEALRIPAVRIAMDRCWGPLS